MIAVDTNILVYAHRNEPAEHDAAASLIKGLAEGAVEWSIPWPCLYEFFSVVTNRRIWKSVASTPTEAFAQLEAWTDSPSLRLLAETSESLVILRELADRPRVTGAIIHDARIAALCVAHGVAELVSADRDFSMFPKLRVRVFPGA
jgi:toxin-antitoxin system PIN domain toxin